MNPAVDFARMVSSLRPPGKRNEAARKQGSKEASWVSAYALTSDYAADVAHSVRRGSFWWQEVAGRCKLFFLRDLPAKWS